MRTRPGPPHCPRSALHSSFVVRQSGLSRPLHAPVSWRQSLAQTPLAMAELPVCLLSKTVNPLLARFRFSLPPSSTPQPSSVAIHIVVRYPRPSLARVSPFPACPFSTSLAPRSTVVTPSYLL